MARSGNTEGTETPAKKTKERRRRTMQKGCHYILRLERYGKLTMKKLTVIAFIIGKNILQVFLEVFLGGCPKHRPAGSCALEKKAQEGHKNTKSSFRKTKSNQIYFFGQPGEVTKTASCVDSRGGDTL